MRDGLEWKSRLLDFSPPQTRRRSPVQVAVSRHKIYETVNEELRCRWEFEYDVVRAEPRERKIINVKARRSSYECLLFAEAFKSSIKSNIVKVMKQSPCLFY